jgi:hypothetical protein
MFFDTRRSRIYVSPTWTVTWAGAKATSLIATWAAAWFSAGTCDASIATVSAMEAAKLFRGPEPFAVWPGVTAVTSTLREPFRMLLVALEDLEPCRMDGMSVEETAECSSPAGDRAHSVVTG